VVFSIASTGEITLHFQQRWLYFNLLPSFPNFFFYTGLTSGQTLLAMGIGGPDFLVRVSMLVAAVVSVFQLYTAWANRSEEVPDGSIVATHIGLWIVTFGGLSLTSIAFVVKICQLPGFNVLIKVLKTIAMVALYAAGVVFSMMMETGHQKWHVPTASFFLFGFSWQVWWMYGTMHKLKTL
jgi:hypothetical protein